MIKKINAKQIMSIFAVFALVFGFGLFTNLKMVSAAATTCEVNDVDGGCNGACSSAESTAGSDDCNGYCEKYDDAATSDCDGFCDQGDVLNSNDCDGFCGANDDACSEDCDPLGQCAFGQDSKLTSTDVRTVASRIVNVILTLLGTVATVIVLVGGFKWMTAGGNEDKVGEAKKLMAAGVVGLIIVLAAYSIATFVIRSLQEATLE